MAAARSRTTSGTRARRWLAAAIACCCCCAAWSPAPALAQNGDAALARMQELRGTLPAEANKDASGLAARLDEAIGWRKELDALRERTRAAADAARAAPAEAERLAAALAGPEPAPDAAPAGAGEDKLTNAVTELEAALAAAREERAAASLALLDATSRGDGLAAELDAARDRLADRSARVDRLGPAEGDGEGSAAGAVSRLALEADRDHARALVDALEAESARREAEAPMLRLRVQALDRRIAALEGALAAARGRLGEALRRSAEEAAQRALADVGDIPPVLESAREETLALLREHGSAADRLARVNEELGEVRRRADEVARLAEDVRARVDATRSGLQVGLILRRAREGLPSEAEERARARALTREASRADVRGFEIAATLDALPEGPEQVSARLLDRHGMEEQDPQAVLAGVRLYAAQREAGLAALRALTGDQGLAQRLQDLAAAHAETADRVAALRQYIDERALWLRSDPMLSPAGLRLAAEGAGRFFGPTRWTQWIAAVAEGRGWVSPSLAAPVGALLAAFLLRAWALRPLRRIEERAARERDGNPVWTLEALGLTLLRVLPFPALLWGGSIAAAAIGGTRLGPAIAAGLNAAAIPLLAGLYAFAIVKPGGVGAVHFHWTTSALVSTRAHLAWFVPVFVSLSGLMAAARVVADEGPDRLFYRVVFIACMLSVAVFVALWLRRGGGAARGALSDPAAAPARKAYPAVHVALTLAFVGLAALDALGWSFSAGALAGKVRDSLFVLGGLLLLRALALRWLAYAKRRASERAPQAPEQDRPAPAPATRAGAAILEEVGLAATAVPPEDDLAGLGEQTRTLVNLTTLVAAAFTIAPLWGDVIPALARLDTLGVIPPGRVDAQLLRDRGAYVLTALDAIRAAVIIGLGMVFIRTLPNLVNALALSRTKMDAGARYASTIILRYALIGAVAFLFLGALRTPWGNLGWILAGLSVGLGFGLQSFFGNLVAGMSLLFERTIRPGDLVRVGDHMGVVKEISIRATILRDFDHRDVVVPNQQLLAGVVINETRTDRLGLARIKVGVAYGSDTALVERLLLDACRSHPDVTGVLCTFDSFGDNALNFTLRVSMREVMDRLGVIHALHMAIDRALRTGGVEISYPQRDLHLRDGTLTVRLERDAEEARDEPPRGEPAKGRG